MLAVYGPQPATRSRHLWLICITANNGPQQAKR